MRKAGITPGLSLCVVAFTALAAPEGEPEPRGERPPRLNHAQPLEPLEARQFPAMLDAIAQRRAQRPSRVRYVVP